MVHWYIAGSLWQCLQSIALLISAKTDYLKAYYQTFDKLMISFVTIELWKPFAPTLYEGDDCFYTIRTDGRGGGAYVIHHQHCWQCFEGFIQVVYSVAYNSPLNFGTLQENQLDLNSILLVFFRTIWIVYKKTWVWYSTK